MSEKRVDVEFGAKTSGIEEGAKTSAEAVQGFAEKTNAAGAQTTRTWAGIGPVFSRVSDSISTASARVKASVGQVAPVFGAVADSVRGDLAGAASSGLGSFGGTAASVASSVRDNWEALPPTFKAVTLAVGAAALAIGAVMIGKKFADDNAEMVESTRDFARALGVTTNEASVYRAALDDVGASESEYLGLAKGLSRQLRTNEDDLKAYGLVTRDAQNNLRPLNQLTMEGIEILKQYGQGADQAIAGQTLFGRAADASSRVLLMNKEAVEQNRTAVEDLNLVVGESAVKAWEDYDSAADQAGRVSKAMGKAVAESVIPPVTVLMNLFNNVAPAAITVLRGALGGLSTAFLGLTNGVIILWETLKALFSTVTEPILSLGKALYQLATGDMTGAMNTMMDWPSKVGQAWSGAMDRMVESSSKTRDRIGSIWAFATGGDSAPGATGAESGTKKARTKTDKPDDKSDPVAKLPESYMQYYEAVLSEDKLAQAKLNGGLEYRKEQELAYWQYILQNAELTSKDRANIVKKASELEIQILQAAGQQKKQIDSDFAAHAESMAMLRVEGEASASQLLYQMGEIDRAQMLQAEQEFEDRRNQIRMSSLQDRLSLIDPERDPVTYAQILQQIEEQQAAHLIRMGALRGEAIQESRSQITTMIGSLEQGMAGVFSQIGTSIKSIGDLIGAMGRMVLQVFTQMLAQMFAKWIANKLMMMAFGKVEALSGVARESAKAGAGGVASMAAAPFPLNLTAPAFGAAMSAAALAFAPVASAAGGWDIPSGMNPVVQAHAREMILPEKISDVIRGMASDSQPGGSGGQRSGDVHYWNVQALDGASLKRVLVDNPAAVAAGVDSAKKNFSMRKS